MPIYEQESEPEEDEEALLGRASASGSGEGSSRWGACAALERPYHACAPHERRSARKPGPPLQHRSE